MNKELKPDYPIVAVYAVDWAGFIDETSVDSDFSPLEGWVVGLLIKEDPDFIVLAQNFFVGSEKVRFTMCVPKCAIKHTIQY